MVACALVVAQPAGLVYAAADKSFHVIRRGDRLAISARGADELSGVYEVNTRGEIVCPILDEVKVAGLTVYEFEEFMNSDFIRDSVGKKSPQFDEAVYAVSVRWAEDESTPVKRLAPSYVSAPARVEAPRPALPVEPPPPPPPPLPVRRPETPVPTAKPAPKAVAVPSKPVVEKLHDNEPVKSVPVTTKKRTPKTVEPFKPRKVVVDKSLSRKTPVAVPVEDVPPPPPPSYERETVAEPEPVETQEEEVVLPQPVVPRRSAPRAESYPVRSAERVRSAGATDVIHSGDKLNIEVMNEKELTGAYTVSEGGTLSYPLLGEVRADDLSLGELKDFLTEQLGRKYLVKPQVRVEFLARPNRSVSVLGQVTKPGTVLWEPNMTLVKLISQVGGLTGNVSATHIRVIRTDAAGAKQSQEYAFESIVKGTTDDVKLEMGDLIFVESVEAKAGSAESSRVLDPNADKILISVLGQVARPGNYYVTKSTTLIRLIAEAGGFTPSAAKNRVRLVRTTAKGKENFTIDAGVIMSGNAEDVAVNAGDLIVVPESYF